MRHVRRLVRFGRATLTDVITALSFLVLNSIMRSTPPSDHALRKHTSGYTHTCTVITHTRVYSDTQLNINTQTHTKTDTIIKYLCLWNCSSHPGCWMEATIVIFDAWKRGETPTKMHIPYYTPWSDFSHLSFHRQTHSQRTAPCLSSKPIQREEHVSRCPWFEFSCWCSALWQENSFHRALHKSRGRYGDRDI